MPPDARFPARTKVPLDFPTRANRMPPLPLNPGKLYHHLREGWQNAPQNWGKKALLMPAIYPLFTLIKLAEGQDGGSMEICTIY